MYSEIESRNGSTSAESVTPANHKATAIVDAWRQFADFCPKQLQVWYLGQSYSLCEGNCLLIGRDYQEGSSSLVSRDHAILGRDHKGFYLVPYPTTNPTFIRKYGSNTFTKMEPGIKYYAQPEDVVHFGGVAGNRMYFLLP